MSDRRTPIGFKVLAVLGALVLVPGGAFFTAANIGTGGKAAIGVAVAWWLVVSAVLGKTLLTRRPDLRTPVRVALGAAAVASVVAAFVVTRGNTVDEQIATADPGVELGDGAERDTALAGGDPGPASRARDRRDAKGGREGPGPARKRDEGAAPSPDDGGEDAAPAAPEGGAQDDPEEADAPGAQEDSARRDKPPARKSPVPAANVELLSGDFSGESGHRGKGDAAAVMLAEGGRVLTFSNFDVDPGAGGLRIYLHAGPTTSDELGEFIDLAGLKGNKGDQQYEIPDDVDLRRYSNVVIWCVPFSTRIAQAPLS